MQKERFLWNCITIPKNSTLNFNQYTKPDKTPCILYEDLKFLIKKIDGYANNSEKSSVTKISEHIPCGYSMSTISAFYNPENKYSLYCGQDCVKRFLFLQESMQQM